MNEEIFIGQLNALTRAALHLAWSDSTQHLLLAGRVGCGKTYAARLACRAHALGGRVVTAFRLARLAPWDEEIDALVTLPGILVLDDLGAEVETKEGRFVGLVDGIVGERHEAGRKIAITTNLTPQDFAQRFGARVVDRIRGAGKIVSSTQPSLRGAESSGGVSLWRYPIGPQAPEPAAANTDPAGIALLDGFVRRIRAGME